MGNTQVVPEKTFSDFAVDVDDVNRFMLKKEVPLRFEMSVAEEGALWRKSPTFACTNTGVVPPTTVVLDGEGFTAFFLFLRESLSRGSTPGVSSGSERETGGVFFCFKRLGVVLILFRCKAQRVQEVRRCCRCQQHNPRRH